MLPFRRPIRVLKIAAATLLLALVALVVVVAFDHTRETYLPRPAGPHKVARTMMVWSDVDRDDPFAPQAGTPRTLLAWIWFPAFAATGAETSQEYLPPAWRQALNEQRGFLVSALLTRNLGTVRVQSIESAVVADSPRRFPVVVFRPGLSALTLGYTALAEDLASRGYVVVGFDAPFRTALVVMPDGRVVLRTAQNNLDRVAANDLEPAALRLQRGWSADIGFALDQLRRLDESHSGPLGDRLDLEHVGVFGHSLGGATAAQFCHDDSRCKAGIDIDGALRGPVVSDGLEQPFLFLLSDHSNEPAAESARIEAQLDSAVRARPKDKQVLVLAGANHFGFSDDGAFLKSPPLRRVLQWSGAIRLEGARQVELTRALTAAFFDAHLKGASPAELARAQAEPEIRREH